MAFKIIEREAVDRWVEADETLWLTADRAKVVAAGDADAAFLFATPGKRISRDEAERYGLVKAKAGKQADTDGEPTWPGTHKELDELGKELGVEFEDGAKVAEKVAALEAAGHKPPEA